MACRLPGSRMFIVCVSDALSSASFCTELFGMKPSFETPGFIAFDLAGGIQFALWNKGDRTPFRTGELCLALDGGPDEMFGRTFVVADPDGNLIRVAPVD